MKIIVSGLCGYMGREVAKAALDSYKGAVLVGGIDLNSSAETPVPCAKGIEDAGAMFSKGSADCIIDFSHHSAIEGLLSFALEKNIPIVVATTG
ncbi:MAG: 4-hydroxy-tetrahydrodipicolinate reductase, partial [Clostridia bacterium]|nr:4-hydroxy-tetrahydrodipicolinate reductase [Clostridia bacterium]